jgi:hypothetical protein
MAKLSFSGPVCNRDRIVKVLVAVIGVLICTGSALAGGGTVLPPCETPHGYSLSDIAVDTADYATGEDAGLSEPIPKVPFEILVAGIGEYTVKPGTMLYLPVYYADNSPPVLAGFPKDIRNQEKDAEFLDSAAFAAYDVTAFFVQVDGKTTILDDDYVVGVRTAPLPDAVPPGTPGGTDYIVSATFLTPLTPGEHTVGIGGLIDGEPVVFVSYTVTVRP